MPRQRYRSRATSSILIATLALAPLALVEPGTASAASAASAAQIDQGGRHSGNWPMGGGDLRNTRSNPLEHTISPINVSKLGVKWTFTTHGDVSATAAVVGGAVYFPDWGGYLNKVNAQTGKLIWQRQISSYTGIAGDTSRTSPAVHDGVVYIGDRSGAHLLAINAANGRLLWNRQLDSHPAASLTASPIVYNGVVYEGVSSVEEAFAGDPNYACCTFRGSLTATDARTGRLLWRTYTIPDNGGQPGQYSGGGIWGGTPTIDPASRTIYVSVGNNYTIPQSAEDCQSAGGTGTQCLSPENRINSVIAMDLGTGAIKWTAGADTFDTWNFGCFPSPPPNNCSDNPGGDYDFGDGTHLFSVPGPDGKPRLVVGAGAKSGTFWAIDAHSGKVLWSASAGPGSYFGGIMWGSSVDSKRIYIAEANYLKGTVSLPDGTTTNGSTWAALDPATGKILWQVRDPSDGVALAPLTSANGVLYAGSTSGYMYAIDAATGRILWSYKGTYSVNNGPSVVHGTVYWGNGYKNTAEGSRTTGTFYAFSVRPGKRH